MRFFFEGQTHTLASALRECLEEESDDAEFVSCTVTHPLNHHLEVHAPSEQHVRRALVAVLDKIRVARVVSVEEPLR